MITTGKALIGIFVLILIAGATIQFVRTKQDVGMFVKEPRDSGDARPIDAIVPETFTTEGTIVDLLKRGAPITCTYTHTKDGFSGSGTIYLDGVTRFSLTDTQVREGKTYDSHILTTNTDTYLWVTGDTQTFAFKMPVQNPDTTLDTENSATLNQTMVYENATYTCSAWNIDEQVFVPPADVAFSDMASFPKAKR